MSVGEFLSRGGGHDSAGTVQMSDEGAEKIIPEIIEKLKES